MLIAIAVNVLSLCLVIWYTFLRFVPSLDDFLYGVKDPKQPPKSEPETGPWKHEFIDTNGIKLHYVSMGKKENPLMLFLHGFPEFWYSWRYQILHFAKEYHVVAVDMRGYNLSDKPKRRIDYDIKELEKDVEGVIKGLGYEKCVLVAHDWGGAVAWSFANTYPELLNRLIVMNLPHPALFAKAIRSNETQMKRSDYIFKFQIPFYAESTLAKNNFDIIRKIFRTGIKNQEHFTTEDEDRFVQAIANSSITAMINYYRAVFKIPERNMFKKTIEVPTLVIWGEQDTALGKELTYGTERFVPHLTMKYIPDAGHWVQQDQPIVVNEYMKEFLTSTEK